MAVKQQIVCDNCGTEKRATNHWFVVENNVIFQKEDIYIPFFRVSTWDAWNSNNKYQLHVCGRWCVSVMQSNWMDSLGAVNLTDPAPALAEPTIYTNDNDSEE